jgi:hypothetical protein
LKIENLGGILKEQIMNETIKLVNRVVLLLLAFGLPFTLLPLRAPYGFERNILLIALFLGLAALRAAANDYGSYRSYKTYTALAAAAALFLAAFLSAQGDARGANLTNLGLWASIVGITAGYVGFAGGVRGPLRRTSALAMIAGSAVAVVALIGQISPVGPIDQGLDYRTSLQITSKALSRSPIWGVGPGRFSEAFRRYKGTDFNRRPDWALRYGLSHSGFLQFATEYGFLGIIGLISLIGPLLARMARDRQELGKREFLLTALPFGILMAAFLLLPYSAGIFWGISFLNMSYTTDRTNNNRDD